MKTDKKDWKEITAETLILTGAVAVIAAGVYFFLVPSKASVSSISGLGMILTNFIPLPLSAITMILNVVLLIIGFFTCGKEFGVKTVYTSVMLPVFLGIFEKIFPSYTSMTGSQELDVLCYILVVSMGLSVLFNRNASSGGLDIVAKILNKYLHMELGKAMSLAGMCVALSSALVYDKKTVVLSILGTYFNGMVLDHFIFGHGGYVLLQKRNRSFPGSSSTTCIAERPFMRLSVHTRWKSIGRSLQSWISGNIRS